MKKQIRDAIFYLLKHNPYYAHFLMDCKMVYDSNKVPTAGVAVMGGVPTFFFNSEFMSKFDTPTTAAILEHEVMHLLLLHTNDKGVDMPDHYIRNVAQDCAINQYIKNLPEGGVTLESLQKTIGHALEPKQTSDYYYKFLKNHVDKLKAQGVGTLDEHDIEGADPANIARGVIKGVSQRAINKSAGNTPDHVLKVTEALGEAKLPWNVLLRNSVSSAVTRKTLATTKKINRRFPLPVPGKKKKREMVLGVCVDESGSVSDEQLTMFMSEIQQIAKTITKTYLIHADCAVADVEDLSKVKFSPKRKASGGTMYQPAIDKCVELKCNMIIYFGDFDTADVPKDPKVPFIWVGVGDSPAPANFGKVIRL